jgi:hypothetical protein
MNDNSSENLAVVKPKIVARIRTGALLASFITLHYLFHGKSNESPNRHCIQTLVFDKKYAFKRKSMP